MTAITTVLATLVALEFLFIMYLETIAPHSELTGKVFNLSSEELNRPTTTNLLKNQGVYNGLIGLGLLYSVYVSSASLEITRLLLIYIVLVAGYGALTSNKKIILTQGGLAIVALLSSFMSLKPSI